jgi:cytochrome c oxidase assembly protein subunit 15
MPLSHNNDQSRATALWLFGVAALVFAMVVLGGATRLTNSGLSITEWAPVTGVIPPLTHQDWLNEFQKYQRIPQYQFVNKGMTLGAFQGIYWWEWTHRLVARLVAAAFVIPFVALLASRQLPRRLVWRCWLLLGLGALQGVVGWWMVASGLEGRVEVAPERLAVHLGLALVLFCMLIWTGLEALFGQGRAWPEGLRWRLPATILAGLVFLQMILGALVAGDRAGQVYNDWPMMNGRLIPEHYLGGGGFFWGLLHSQAAVQFNHRITAYLLLAGALAAAALALRSRDLPRSAPTWAVGLAGLVLLQAGLGVMTLMSHAPLWLALPHQCLAAVVLATALAFAWRVRRA